MPAANYNALNPREDGMRRGEENVQTSKFLLIGRRLEGVQTDQPHADDARASRPHTPQGQVNIFCHITTLHLVD